MASVGKVVTTTYTYDINDERIALGANGATTTYPSKLYNVNGTAIAKHLFGNGAAIADIQGSTSTAAVYYLHDDHLLGTNLVSNSLANIDQLYANPNALTSNGNSSYTHDNYRLLAAKFP